MAIEGKVKPGRSLAKDFHRLMRNIDGMSGGQARLVEWDETDLKKGFTVAVIPDSGLYKDGEFVFSITCNTKYPNLAPSVYCKTQVYHPNIDTIEDDGEICLNMLDDDWSASMTLDDVVQGILFLMYNPNLDDALCVIFNPSMDEEVFASNVRQSLDGGCVDGYHFQRNKVIRGEGGVVIKDGGVAKMEEIVCTDEQADKEDSKQTGAAAESKTMEERRKVATVEKGDGEWERGVIGIG